MHETRGRIVIVEDDAGLNRALARLLHAVGFECSGFDSAEALLASDAKQGADCFVLDVHLPGISGFELRTKLDDAELVQPIIFVTAHDDLETRRSAGNAACLIKPFSSRTLIETIDAALLATMGK